MGVKYTREIERFPAISDDGGYETIIVVDQDFIEAGSLNSHGEVLPGLKSARTIDGHSCNHEGTDRFRVVALDIVVKRQR